MWRRPLLPEYADHQMGSGGINGEDPRPDIFCGVRDLCRRSAGRMVGTYAVRLAELEVVAGCAAQANHFFPHQQVTRGEAAALLVRASDLQPGPPAGFADTSGSEYAADIDSLAAMGITEGCATDPPGTVPMRRSPGGVSLSCCQAALGSFSGVSGWSWGGW